MWEAKSWIQVDLRSTITRSDQP